MASRSAMTSDTFFIRRGLNKTPTMITFMGYLFERGVEVGDDPVCCHAIECVRVYPVDLRLEAARARQPV